MSVFGRLLEEIKDLRSARAEYGGANYSLLAPDVSSDAAVSLKASQAGIPFARYNRYGGQYFYGWGDGLTDRFNLFQGTQIDFAQEIGDLTDSSLIMAAVNWLSRTLPEASLQVVRLRDDDKEEVQRNHPLISLFKEPMQGVSGKTLWKSFATSWITDGNVYLQKIRSARNKVVGLRYWPHYCVRTHRPDDRMQLIDYYIVTVDGIEYEIWPDNMIHFRDGLDIRTGAGESPLKSVLREIYTDNEIATFSAVVLKNLGVMPYLITPKEAKGLFDGPTVKNTLERATSRDNRGRLAVLDGPVESHKLGVEPDKLNMSVMAGRPETRIPAVIGINAIVLYLEAGLNRSIFHNVSEALRDATERYLIPLNDTIEQTLDIQLLPEFETDGNFAVRHDYSRVRALQKDALMEARITEILVRSRVIDQAEARERHQYKFDEPQYRDVWYPVLATTLTQSPIDGGPDSIASMPEPKGHSFKALPASTDPGDVADESAREFDRAAGEWDERAPAAWRGLADAEPVKPNGSAGII